MSLDRDDKLRKEMYEEEHRQRRIESWTKKKSPCLKGRQKHYFREPRTRSLTPDLECKWCGKTVAQVRAEQKGGKRLSTTETCPECRGNILMIYDSGFIVCLKCKYRWKV